MFAGLRRRGTHDNLSHLYPDWIPYYLVFQTRVLQLKRILSEQPAPYKTRVLYLRHGEGCAGGRQEDTCL